MESDMRMKSIAAALVFLVGAGAASLAQAAPGYSTGNVNMRAGPSTAYPAVTVIPVGAPVEILGCLNGWAWCDTVYAGNRGWVAGSYLNASYRGARVPFVSYAPRIGVPVVAYNRDVYWRTHYRARPFYRQYYVGPNHACVRGPRGAICR